MIDIIIFNFISYSFIMLKQVRSFCFADNGLFYRRNVISILRCCFVYNICVDVSYFLISLYDNIAC